MADSNRGPADYPQAAQWRGSDSRIVSHQSDSRRRSIQREAKMSEKLEGLEQECRKVAVSALYEMSTEDGETPEEAQPDVIAEHFAAFIHTRIAAAEAAALRAAANAVYDFRRDDQQFQPHETILALITPE